MRYMVDVREQHRDWLEQQAWQAHRSLREHASYLLDQMIQREKAAQEEAHRQQDEAVA